MGNLKIVCVARAVVQVQPACVGLRVRLFYGLCLIIIYVIMALNCLQLQITQTTHLLKTPPNIGKPSLESLQPKYETQAACKQHIALEYLGKFCGSSPSLSRAMSRQFRGQMDVWISSKM